MSKDINVNVHKRAKPAAGFYLMTYVGTLIYFVDKAHGFGQVLLAFLQALVWPAILINHIFTVLHI